MLTRGPAGLQTPANRSLARIHLKAGKSTSAPVTVQPNYQSMKGIILAIISSALCTAGVCFVALKPTRQTTIDGSNEERFKQSVDEVKAGLSQQQQEHFEQAMTTLSLAAIQPAGGSHPLASAMALAADPTAASRRLRTRINGLNFDGIIAAAELVQSERDANMIPGNEMAAIASLKNISSAQAQCQASGVIDSNNNGQGEYGFFAELAGRSTRV
jgi:hypothetical protein